MRFCSNFTSMWSKYLSNNEKRNFRLPMSALGNIKCLFGKLIFVTNFELKLSSVTVANANIGSLKCLPTLFDMCLDHMLVKF